MELTNQVATLQDEVKLLKGEIKSVLKEIRAAVLTRDNPFAADAAPSTRSAGPAERPGAGGDANLPGPFDAPAPPLAVPPAPQPVAQPAAPPPPAPHPVAQSLPQAMPQPQPVVLPAAQPVVLPAAQPIAQIIPQQPALQQHLAQAWPAQQLPPSSPAQPVSPLVPPPPIEPPPPLPSWASPREEAAPAERSERAAQVSEAERVEGAPRLRIVPRGEPAAQRLELAAAEEPAPPPAWSISTVAGLAVWAEEALVALGPRRYHFVLQLAAFAELLPAEARDMLAGLPGETPDEGWSGRPANVNECLVYLRQLEAIVHGERPARLPRPRGRRVRRIR